MKILSKVLKEYFFKDVLTHIGLKEKQSNKNMIKYRKNSVEINKLLSEMQKAHVGLNLFQYGSCLFAWLLWTHPRHSHTFYSPDLFMKAEVFPIMVPMSAQHTTCQE